MRASNAVVVREAVQGGLDDALQTVKEQPFGPVEPPPGDGPLVLVAPSTAQDPEHRMVRATLEGLADESVRVLATTNRRDPPVPLSVPDNARVVDWLSYEQSKHQRLLEAGLDVQQVGQLGHGQFGRWLVKTTVGGPGQVNSSRVIEPLAIAAG